MPITDPDFVKKQGDSGSSQSSGLDSAVDPGSSPGGASQPPPPPPTPKPRRSAASSGASRLESLIRAERESSPGEKEHSEEKAPKLEAPRPKILDEEEKPKKEESVDLGITSRSSGRVVDKRASVKESIVSISDSADPTTVYADEEENKFIEGVMEEHKSNGS